MESKDKKSRADTRGTRRTRNTKCRCSLMWKSSKVTGCFPRFINTRVQIINKSKITLHVVCKSTYFYKLFIFIVTYICPSFSNNALIFCLITQSWTRWIFEDMGFCSRYNRTCRHNSISSIWILQVFHSLQR